MKKDRVKGPANVLVDVIKVWSNHSRGIIRRNKELDENLGCSIIV